MSVGRGGGSGGGADIRHEIASLGVKESEGKKKQSDAGQLLWISSNVSEKLRLTETPRGIFLIAGPSAHARRRHGSAKDADELWPHQQKRFGSSTQSE